MMIDQLRLMKVKDKMLKGEWGRYYKKHEGKTYVFLGEFAHAPGHALLCEFGNGFNMLDTMVDIEDFEFIDSHPDDVIIEIPCDNSWKKQVKIPVAEQRELYKAMRSAHDGICPMCGSKVFLSDNILHMYQCWTCDFHLTKNEVKEIKSWNIIFHHNLDTILDDWRET